MQSEHLGAEEILSRLDAVRDLDLVLALAVDDLLRLDVSARGPESAMKMRCSGFDTRQSLSFFAWNFELR